MIIKCLFKNESASLPPIRNLVTNLPSDTMMYLGQT